MLNKISNITPLNNGSKESLSQVKHYRENPLIHESLADSASFSPAMELLKILKWDSYKMEYPAKNKLSLIFSIDGLEFHTSLNVDTLDTLSVFNYEVYYRELIGESSVFFRVRLNQSALSNILTKRKLYGLHELFKDIAVHEKDTTEELFNESAFLNNLVSGLAGNINSDLSFINNSLIYFLNILLKLNFNKSNMILPDEENFFILLKIKLRPC